MVSATLQRITPNQAKRKKAAHAKPRMTSPIHSQRELGQNLQPQAEQRYRTCGMHLRKNDRGILAEHLGHVARYFTSARVGLTQDEVRDGDEPPLTSQLRVTWTAHPRSLDRFVYA